VPLGVLRRCFQPRQRARALEVLEHARLDVVLIRPGEPKPHYFEVLRYVVSTTDRCHAVPLVGAKVEQILTGAYLNALPVVFGKLAYW
jgi:hypothetical protein